MSLDTLSNGDSGLTARTKINSAIGLLNGMSEFAHLSPGTGNDSTAVMGDPSHPYQTFAAAFTASLSYSAAGLAKIFLTGIVNTPPTIDGTSGLTELHLHGNMRESTLITGINFANFSAHLEIVGNGRSRIGIGPIVMNGSPGTNGAAGSADGAHGDAGGAGGACGGITIRQCHLASLVLNGGTGGSGGTGADGMTGSFNGGDGGRGGNGGTSGDIHLIDCSYENASITTIGGSGGAGAGGGNGGFEDDSPGPPGADGSGGNGGSSGNIYIEGCHPPPGTSGPTVSAPGGTGGPNYGWGGGSGDDGHSGSLNMKWSEIAYFSNVSDYTTRMSYYNSSFYADDAY